MNRKAFTLIELLVVIAIIAILAAILFPVFAQAKNAAKAAASLSNTKQETLGNIMYAGDFDDTLPLGTAWKTGHDQLCYGGGACFSVWSWSIQPYVKNAQLFTDPLATPNPQRAANQANFDTYYIQYGYNYTYLSPWFNNPGGPAGLTSTAVGQPADTVMLVSKWANSENKSGFDWATWFPSGTSDGGMLAAAAVDSPDCWHIPQWCLDSWGTGGFYQNTLLLTEVAGGLTGGNSTRAANNSVVSFVDGHVKKLAPGALSVGTNWSKTTANSAVVINDVTRYLWDTL
jgi:prepilin-type N-terminal cleavage/methylation domain-containing protein/prepilin-type processing-associated H-X9-DG protein